LVLVELFNIFVVNGPDTTLVAIASSTSEPLSSDPVTVINP
jgi:hypothetical protein